MKCKRFDYKIANTLKEKTPFLATFKLVNSNDILLVRSIERSEKHENHWEVHVIVIYSKDPSQVGNSFCSIMEDLTTIYKYEGVVELSN